MSVYEWKPVYKLDIKRFDDQHRKLFGYMAELDTAMRQGKGKDALGGVIEKLIDYTLTHFAAEEKAMKESGFLGLAAHMREHEALTNRVREFRKDFESGKALVSVDLLKFLKDWIANHIKETDRKYAAHLIEKGFS